MQQKYVVNSNHTKIETNTKSKFWPTVCTAEGSFNQSNNLLSWLALRTNQVHCAQNKICTQFNSLCPQRDRGTAGWEKTFVTHPCQGDGPAGYDSPVQASEKPEHQAQAGALQANKCTTSPKQHTIANTAIKCKNLKKKSKIKMELCKVQERNVLKLINKRLRLLWSNQTHAGKRTQIGLSSLTQVQQNFAEKSLLITTNSVVLLLRLPGQAVSALTNRLVP